MVHKGRLIAKEFRYPPEGGMLATMPHLYKNVELWKRLVIDEATDSRSWRWCFLYESWRNLCEFFNHFYHRIVIGENGVVIEICDNLTGHNPSYDPGPVLIFRRNPSFSLFNTLYTVQFTIHCVSTKVYPTSEFVEH